MKTSTVKTACILSAILLALCLFSALWLLLYSRQTRAYTAFIHVDGTLMESIPLLEVDTPYEFRIQTTDGHYNNIYVDKGSIRISSADCPDLICVKQGPVTNSLLPITCLPHKLVISLKPTETTTNIPDTITH